MTENRENPYVISATREIAASAARVFELIADPSQHPQMDGNDNLVESAQGQRVHGKGAVFTTALTRGGIRHNHVVEFEEGRRIAWLPSEPDQAAPGHLWRWELERVDEAHTNVTHTYDWSTLTDPNRLVRARATTASMLRASLDRLAQLAEP